MKKHKILIPLAVSVMLLPLTLNNSAYAATSYVATAQVSTASASAAVLEITNEYRAQYGLPALRRSSALDRAAAIRAAEIAQKFSHNRPDGSKWSTVSALALGENIARGHRNAEKAVVAWMNSSGHRANILRSSYGSIGIAAVNVNGSMYWVQLFGK